jgi:hypothetical protein
VDGVGYCAARTAVAKMLTTALLLLMCAATTSMADVALVPALNCTKLGHKLCYQGSQMDIAEVVKLDPLACKPPYDAQLIQGNCSTRGYGTFKGNDPIFKKVELWGGSPFPPPPPGTGSAMAAEFRRWDSSTNCSGAYSIGSTDVMNFCTPFSIPAPASIFVEQTNGTYYSSYHYDGVKDCSGSKRTFLMSLLVGECSGDLGGYSHMRVWVHNSTFHCSPGCECCPCRAGDPFCRGTCPSCGGDICACPP